MYMYRQTIPVSPPPCYPRYTINQIMIFGTFQYVCHNMIINSIFEHWVFYLMSAIFTNAISVLKAFGILMNGKYLWPFPEP